MGDEKRSAVARLAGLAGLGGGLAGLLALMAGGSAGGVQRLGVGGKGQNAKTNWWEAGGASGCLAAYQGKGAVDYAASKTNLANPGVLDLTGDSTTWSQSSGWSFVQAQEDALNTGIIPASSSVTHIIQYANLVTGYLAGSSWIGISWYFKPGGYWVEYSNGGALLIGVPLLEGNLCCAGTSAYRNGVAEVGVMAGAGASGRPYTLGRINGVGPYASVSYTGDIIAFAYYSGVLTAGQVAAVAAAMGAL